MNLYTRIHTYINIYTHTPILSLSPRFAAEEREKNGGQPLEHSEPVAEADIEQEDGGFEEDYIDEDLQQFMQDSSELQNDEKSHGHSFVNALDVDFNRPAEESQVGTTAGRCMCERV
jgi:hypothetical protein